jgi:hypothetical protein
MSIRLPSFLALSMVAACGCSGPRDLGDSVTQESTASDGASCSGDPTLGFSEYTDTFKVQHPWNLAEADRFSFLNGIYSTWIHHGDQPFKPGSPTAPRTEMRWLQDWNTGERMWSADVLVDPPTSHSAIMQVKSDDAGAHEAIYLQVDNGHLQNGVGPIIATNVVGRWLHLNVAYNTATRVARVWLNNCLIFTRTHPVDATWYFKNGIYGCDPAICQSHFQNIRFFRK